jgi:hypothetical protein
MATSTTYNRAFWNVMKGKEENNQNASIPQSAKSASLAEA